MKTHEEWAELYFKDKVRDLTDLIRMIQDEVKNETIEAVNKLIKELS